MDFGQTRYTKKFKKSQYGVRFGVSFLQTRPSVPILHGKSLLPTFFFILSSVGTAQGLRFNNY